MQAYNSGGKPPRNAKAFGAGNRKILTGACVLQAWHVSPRADTEQLQWDPKMHHDVQPIHNTSIIAEKPSH